MRLWTIHPRHLDTKGLLAAWREALLAQQVLHGRTKGYRNHPQLRRFKSSPDPLGAIASYLQAIYSEAAKRGYGFNGDKIGPTNFNGKIECTRGQLLYEWAHLREKLKARDPDRYRETEGIGEPEAHPIFGIVDGAIEDWEVRPR